MSREFRLPPVPAWWKARSRLSGQLISCLPEENGLISKHILSAHVVEKGFSHLHSRTAFGALPEGTPEHVEIHRLSYKETNVLKTSDSTLDDRFGIAVPTRGFESSLPIFIYVLISFLFLNFYQYQIDPDEVSYISIARQYSEGDYSTAINGLWSPMICWLLAPFIKMNVDPILALKLLSIATGALTLVAINLLLRSTRVARKIRMLYMFSFCPLVAWYALMEGCPDLLALCVLLFYVHLITGAAYHENKHSGYIAGMLGGLAYLSKSYNFYFFLLHFTFLNGYYATVSKASRSRREILWKFATGLFVFMTISGIWIGLISHKYNKFTISTAGSYNLALNGPDVKDYPMDTDGLIAPPNPTAVSTWDDPTYQNITTWNPLGSIDNFEHLLQTAAKNVGDYLIKLSNNPVIFFTIAYSIIKLSTTTLKKFDHTHYLLFTVALYPLGYYLLHIENRYVWLNRVLLYVLSACIANKLLKSTKMSEIQSRWVMAVIAVCIIAAPVHRLIHNINTGKGIYILSRQISAQKGIEHQNIAGQADTDQAGDWCSLLFISYYLQDRYYGIIKKDESDLAVTKELLANHIQYYFVHGRLKNRLKILKPEMKIGDITVYKILSPTAAL